MVLDLIIVGALSVYFIVAHLSYRKMESLLMSHNYLILYHTYFLQSKHKDYGDPVQGIPDD